MKVDMSEREWKTKVKSCIRDANAQELMTDMEKYRKLDDSEMLNENFERKSYLRQLNLESARTKFKFRTKMTRFVKMN